VTLKYQQPVQRVPPSDWWGLDPATSTRRRREIVLCRNLGLSFNSHALRLESMADQRVYWTADRLVCPVIKYTVYITRQGTPSMGAGKNKSGQRHAGAGTTNPKSDGSTRKRPKRSKDMSDFKLEHVEIAGGKEKRVRKQVQCQVLFH
jgi:hypothetical protein